MIITKEGKIVVAVGEPIAYAGRVWRCAQDTGSVHNPCTNRCAFTKSSLQRLCRIMECRFDERPDGLAVHFVPFGAEEGGEDERK